MKTRKKANIKIEKINLQAKKNINNQEEQDFPPAQAPMESRQEKTQDQTLNP
jgi:hypothetical protein